LRQTGPAHEVARDPSAGAACDPLRVCAGTGRARPRRAAGRRNRTAAVVRDPTGTAAAVVAQWAAERSAYDHASGACSGTCGHYTQLVWSKSSALGCGVASCAGGGEIWVCNYDPAGNVMGEAPY
jgi:hypothetical protein